jgi:hypothetical protein
MPGAIDSIIKALRREGGVGRLFESRRMRYPPPSRE